MIISRIDLPHPGRGAVWAVAAMLSLMTLTAIPANASNDASASGVVDTLHAALIRSMKIGEDGGYAARYKVVEPVVSEQFDLHLISRLVLGGHWSKLNAAQRQKFEKTMGRFMTANYASKFNSFSGQSFELKGEKKQGEKVAIVQATFKSGKGKTRQFDYQLRKSDTGWMLVNVAVDGVSDLSLKRAEFTDVLKAHGFDELVAKLETRIKNMAEGKEE